MLDQKQSEPKDADNENISEDCENGMHSWTDKVGRMPANTKCNHCDELYGNPD